MSTTAINVKRRENFFMPFSISTYMLYSQSPVQQMERALEI